MRYSTQPTFRKYVEGYSFLSFATTFGDKYGKILMDTATKTMQQNLLQKEYFKKLQKLQEI